MVKVEYSWKPTRCDCCHLIGHAVAKCRTKIASLQPDSSKFAPTAQGMSVQVCPPDQLPADLESCKVNDPLIPSGPPRPPSEACSGSTLVASNLKEVNECFSSGNVSASSLLPPLSSAEGVRLDTNLSDEDRNAAFGSSPKALESVQHEDQSWGVEDLSTQMALSDRAEGSEAGSSMLKLECCEVGSSSAVSGLSAGHNAADIFDAPGIYNVDSVVPEGAGLPCFLDEKESVSESKLQLSEHTLAAGVPVANCKNAPGPSAEIDPDITPESISRIARKYCLNQSESAGSPP